LKHNRKKILEDKRLLIRFVKQVYSAHDTPSLIKLVARDDDYLVLCSAIINAGQKDTTKFFQGLTKECHRQGFDIYSMQVKLTPVARALGLGVSLELHNDYYDLLGIAPDADSVEIRKAYRELARKTHPDTSKSAQRGNQAFAELNEAYQTLIDPDLRYQYDQSRHNIGPWNEQAGRPQKHRKRAMHLYQIGVILVFFVFAAYISDIIFQEKAITNDPYSEMVKNDNKSEDKELDHNREIEGQGSKGDDGGNHDLSISSHNDNTAQERLPDAESKKNQLFLLGLNETSMKKKENPGFLSVSKQKDNKSEVVKGKRTADHRSPGNTAMKQQKDSAKAVHPSDPRESQKKLFSPANSKQAPSSGVHSEQLAQEDVHVMRHGTRPSADSSQDISVVLPAFKSNDIAPDAAQAKKPAEPMEKQPKQLAVLKGSERKEELDARIKAFLNRYCREYENKDLTRLARFFAPDAIEKGKPFSKLLAKYQENFRTINAIQYHIRLKKYSEETSTGNIAVSGNFSLQWRMDDGMLRKSAGDIFMTLYENGDSLLIKKLDYNFRDKVTAQF